MRLYQFLGANKQVVMNKYCSYLIAIVLISSIFGCATERTVIRSMEPSPVSIPSNIKRIGIINSNVPSEAVKIQGRLDLAVAEEDLWLTKKGTEAAISGLFDELEKDKRFGMIKLLDSVPDSMQDFAAVPQKIDWPSVEALCDLHDVDVIFSLAYYETETKLSIKKSTMLQPNMMRENEKVPAKEITMETLIENGWRIYDPKKSAVLDEFVFNDQFVAKGKGTNEVRALRSINRRDTLLNQSRSRGSSYGLRLLPSEINIDRIYYVKGSELLEKAHELVIQDDWAGAAYLWKEESENQNAKIGSRGCHNVAVNFERDGYLNTALQWATRANSLHETKTSLEYINSLNDRITQKGLLDKQLALTAMAK